MPATVQVMNGAADPGLERWTQLRIGSDLPQPQWQTQAQRIVADLLVGAAEDFAHGCRSTPSPKFPSDTARRPELLLGSGLGPDECSAFVRAMDQGLVEFGPQGGFSIPGARACSPNLHLVGRNEDHVALHTEVLIHVGTYAELILDHAWAEDSLVFDPFFDSAALDLWGYAQPEGAPPDGEIVFACEAKSRVPGGDGLQSLYRALKVMSEDPGADVRSGYRRKYIELVQLSATRPISFLLTAEGARWWYTSTVAADGRLVLERADGPAYPPRSYASAR